jgi:HlyD family secretion protein
MLKHLLKKISIKAFWFTAAIAIAGVLFSLFTFSSNPRTGNAVETQAAFYRVKRGGLCIDVLASGDLKALNTQEIRSHVEGQTKIIRMVPEGTLITEADVAAQKVLVELDSSSLKDKAVQQEIAVNQAQSDYDQAVENYKIQVKEDENNIDAKQLTVTFARMDLEKYLGRKLTDQILKHNKQVSASLVNDKKLKGEALQEKRKFQSEIDLAKEECQRALNKLDGSRQLFEKGYVNREELEVDELAYKRRTVELGHADTAMSLFLTYDFIKQTKKLLSDFKVAQNALEQTRSSAKSNEAKARSTQEAQKLILDLQLNNLKELGQQIANCVIYAKQPGLVVYSKSDAWSPNQSQIGTGATVYENQELIHLPDLSVMAVDVKVPESAIEEIKPGQKARIQLDAFPELTLNGHVTQVAMVPHSPAWFTDGEAKFYNVEVTISDAHNGLKPGLSAMVQILIEAYDKVLFIPVQAVHYYKNKSICYVMNKGDIEGRAIVTGKANANHIHIKSGLDEGEHVLLRNPLPGEEVNYTF